MTDQISRFLLQGAPVRGEIVTLDEAWREVVARHAVPPVVRERLGELSAAALLLAATLKFDGALVMQIHGDGPVALFVVECLTDGSYRATVKLRDEAAEFDDSASFASLVNVNQAGRFVVTLDPRSRSSPHAARSPGASAVTSPPTSAPASQPWQGIVSLEGDSIAEVLERYMQQSEQVPTRLWLAADSQRAAGLLLQRIPEEGGKPAAAARGADLGAGLGVNDSLVPDGDHDGWERMQRLAETITREELLGLETGQILHRLFWQESLPAFDRKDLRFACSCSREKVVGMLALLGREEVESILAERSRVDVRCDFCNELRSFDPVDCALIFAGSEAPPVPQTRH